jgi:UDP:flavonoid glycosyltransferase YjiC (YdhE family)
MYSRELAEERTVLLTWEMGGNMGHATRLRALAGGLRRRGFTVVAAVRDVPTAASILGPAEIPFIQGPCPAADPALAAGISNYADILLAHGWRDPALLWANTAAWITLFRALRPTAILHDASPAARLASWICGISAVYVGNGYDIPPAVRPLRPFPGGDAAAQARAAQNEAEALANANAVIAFYRARPITALRDLFDGNSVLATFSELDHYGARPGEPYAGTLYRSQGDRVAPGWPPHGSQHVFAYLRPVPGVVQVLAGLAKSGVHVTCFAPGLDPELAQRFRGTRLCWFSQPVLFDALYERTQACVTFGSEGTVASFLLRGVPQVLLPVNLEGALTARRVQEMGAGRIVAPGSGERAFSDCLRQMLDEPATQRNAAGFAAAYAGHDAERVAESVVTLIVEACGL